MSVQELLLLLAGVFGGGGALTGLLAWRKDARQGPIDKSTAHVANSVALSETAMAWVQYQDEKMKIQDEKMIAQDEKMIAQDEKTHRMALQISELSASNDNLTERVSRTESRLSGWNFWYDDLSGRWSYHREQDNPPAKPVG